MVRTRHAADADDEEQDNFLSLNSRRSRLSRRVPIQEDDSDDSGVVQFNREQGPVRRAGHRAAAKRVSYVEDYIDEYPIRRTRRSGHSLADDAEEDDCNSKRQLDGSLSNVASGEDDQYTPNSLHKRLRTSRNKSLVGEDESPPSPLRKKRKTAGFQVAQPSPKTSKQVKMEELEEMEESGIRRSSRTRKIVYNSFHMSDMSNKPKRSLGPNNAPDEDVEEEEEEEDEENNGNFTDMYSRVKRKRKCVKRYMDGETEVNGAQADDGDEEDDEEDDDDDGDDDNDDGDDDNEDGENEEDKDESKPNRRSYYLRENKPRTNFYNVIPETRRTKNRFFNEHDVRPPPRTHRRSEIYMSPARKHTRIPRRRTAFHGSSSTSSSASGSSSDEEHFQKRKAKSMKKSRQRCLPMNFDLKNLAASTVLRDRQKIGSSLADVDPMNIDKSITFASVGGLGKHVRALKEMVVFPLLYPEIFERFKISPPRGVLFYGPPGTGKTLVARALANECSKDDRRVAFYMRKGADCLSKWVGESERQLRLLFDQAYQTRPSIIFFDEIDGLAPVRSSRQDQIHSSIVSTLLALMDGLDSRGEIVVIGATNRIDSIDPALRRPGRFDREFLFPLPSLQARSQILKIHTKEWNPPLSEKFVNEVAENCIGYCGADMKALCTEAALLALRKRYPQIYTSTDKLQIDVSSIHIGSKDFYYGMQNIVPASQRSVTSPGRALSTQIQPLLHAQFKHLISLLNDVFPSILNQLANLDNDVSKPPDENDLDVYSDEEGTDMSIYEQKNKGRRKSSTIPQNQGKFFDFISYATRRPSTHRPRLMLSGNGDQGQSSHLAPAILHHLEQLPVHVVDLPSLFAVSARSPEESCAQIFREAKRTSPSIIYLPHINQWWTVVGETVKTTLLTLIQDLDPSSPLFLLATSEEDYAEIDFDIQDVFDEFSGEVTSMRNPTEEERRAFFTDIILNQTTIPPVVKTKENQVVEDLPKAPPPEPRKLTEAELKKLSDHEEATLTELRLFLRDVLTKLGRDRKFWIFAKPVDMEDVPDYYDIISKPMDLSTMMSKVDLHHYTTVKEFMVDINLICSNALEYNPDRDAQSRIIRHRACALRDTTNAIIKTELDEEFEKVCQGIAESRTKRGVESTTTAPSYYHTRPLNQGPMHPLAITRKLTPTSHLSQQQIDRNIRLSRRLQGGHADDGPSLEEVEKSARAVRSMVRNSPKKENENTPQAKVKSQGSDTTGLTASQESKHANQEKTSCSKSNSGGGSSTKKYAKKSIWGRSSYKKRKKKRSVKSEIEDENEDLVELDASVVDDDDDDAEDDDEEGSESEVQMEVEELASPNKQSPAPGTTTRSPRRDNHEATSSQDVLGKSPQKNSLNRCLNIDVGMKTPKDVQKSPSQKSPRLISPHLSDKQSSNEQINGIVSNNFNSEASPKLYQSDSCQKSPRQRHVSGSRSPRSQDISLPTEPDSKPSTRKSHDGSKEPPPDEELANINATSVTDPPTASDGVQVVVSAFDSGLGSSDSSGDSNDSAGKVLAGSVLTKPEECKDITDQQQVDTPSGSTEESQDVHMKDNEEKECPKLRVTRSMLHSKNTDSEIEHKVPVIIDKERLTNLLNTVVKTTEHYTICQLEKLYSIFAQCIFQHRMDLDKSQLLEVMEKRLGQYTNNMSKKMLKRKTNTGV